MTINDKDNVVPIEQNLPHETRWVQCLHCFYKWLAVYPDGEDYLALECPECKKCDTRAYETMEA